MEGWTGPVGGEARVTGERGNIGGLGVGSGERGVGELVGGVGAADGLVYPCPSPEKLSSPAAGIYSSDCSPPRIPP